MKYILILAIILLSCGSPPALHEQPSVTLPNEKEEEMGGIQVVIETPAGAVHPIHYEPSSQQFLPDTIGKIPFLPFPANWGFIPSTQLPHLRESSFAPVEVMVLCERLESGRVVGVKPIAAVIIEEKERRSLIVLAAPVNPAFRNLDIRDYPDLMIRYPGVKESLESWLQQRRGPASAKILDWKDGNYALRFIEASYLQPE
jgi:inorganic pyrophosphatase